MTKQDKQTMNKTEELKEMVTDKLRDLHYAGLEPLELKYIDGIVDLIKQSNREAVESERKNLLRVIKSLPLCNICGSGQTIEKYFNSLEKGTTNE